MENIKINYMKHTIIIILILTGLNMNAQTNGPKNILTSYSKQQITFDNSVVNLYRDKYAKIANDFYTKMIDDETYIRQPNILHGTYSGRLVNLSDKELNKLKTVYRQIHTDGEAYLKKISFKEAKKYALSEFKKNHVFLYKEVENTKIKFKNKDFEDYAIKVMALSFEQCTENITHKEFDLKALKLREQYANAIRTASKKDVELLLLLNKKEIIRCTEHTIERQYSAQR